MTEHLLISFIAVILFCHLISTNGFPQTRRVNVCGIGFTREVLLIPFLSLWNNQTQSNASSSTGNLNSTLSRKPITSGYDKGYLRRPVSCKSGDILLTQTVFRLLPTDIKSCYKNSLHEIHATHKLDDFIDRDKVIYQEMQLAIFPHKKMLFEIWTKAAIFNKSNSVPVDGLLLSLMLGNSSNSRKSRPNKTASCSCLDQILEGEMLSEKNSVVGSNCEASGKQCLCYKVDHRLESQLECNCSGASETHYHTQTTTLFRPNPFLGSEKPVNLVENQILKPETASPISNTEEVPDYLERLRRSKTKLSKKQRLRAIASGRNLDSIQYRANAKTQVVDIAPFGYYNSYDYWKNYNEAKSEYLGSGYMGYPWFNATAFWVLFITALIFTVIICVVCFIVLCCIY